MRKVLIVFVLVLLCAGIASASPICKTWVACVDDSDYITVENGQLSMFHETWRAIGWHESCADQYKYKIFVDGIDYSVNDAAELTPYTINDADSIPIGITSLDSFTQVGGRDAFVWADDPPNHRIYIDDYQGETDVYTIRLCGEPTNPVPEFPSIFLPVTMIIGFLGSVFLIQRTREH